MLRESDKIRPFLEIDDQYDEQITDFDDIESEDDKKINAQEKAMQLLSEKCKKILELYYYKGLKHIEIAHQLNLANSDTSKSTKQRCFKQLKQLSVSILNN